jgi:hypothetical protein
MERRSVMIFHTIRFNPQAECPPSISFFPSFIIVAVVAKPYADTRDKSGKNAYTVKIEVKN